MKKYYISIITLLLVLCTLAACTNGSNSTDGTATQPPSPMGQSMENMVETVDFGKLGWTINGFHGYSGFPLLIKTPDPEHITLDLQTEHGAIVHHEGTDEISITGFSTQLGQTCTVPSNHAVYWHTHHIREDGTYSAIGTANTNYIRVLLKAEEHIVGYSVLMLSRHYFKNSCFELQTLQYIYYPKVDGKYQTVPEEYVNAEMDRIIAEAEEAYQAKLATKPQEKRLNVSLTHQLQQFDLSKEGCPGVPILPVFSDYEGLSLEYITTQGSFFYDPDEPEVSENPDLQYLGQQFTVPQGHAVYWQPYRLTEDGIRLPEEPLYTYEFAIILRDGEHIVGCTIIDIAYYSVYTPQQLFATVVFPKVDGKYQNVTEEYILGWIEAHQQ